MEQRIVMSRGAKKLLAELFSCSVQMVSYSLSYKKNSPLARQIREEAKNRGGTIIIDSTTENKKFLKAAIEQGEAQVLTISLATKLKGKKIATLYYGYAGQDGYKEMVVGDIVSQYDLACRERLICGKTRAEDWGSFMTPEQLAEKKNTMCLLDENDKNTFIYSHPCNNGGFTCSDMDRYVMFIELT